MKSALQIKFIIIVIIIILCLDCSNLLCLSHSFPSQSLHAGSSFTAARITAKLLC